MREREVKQLVYTESETQYNNVSNENYFLSGLLVFLKHVVLSFYRAGH